MSSVIVVGGTSALVGSMRDAHPAATSRSCTSCTPRTWRQISQTPTSPHAWPAGGAGGACRRRAPRDRLEARNLAGVVEEHAVEADMAAVELDRLVGVCDADADVV